MKKITVLFIALMSFFVWYSNPAYADSLQLVNPENEHCYQLIDNGMSWHNAASYCENLGAHLVTITTPEEDQFIFDNFVFSMYSPWMGGTDEGDEGNWRWITGEPWIYDNWNSGEPNNCCPPEICGGSECTPEHYLIYFDAYTFGWNDIPGGELHFICEWDHLCLEEYQVLIDIKPGSDPNSVNLINKVVIPVAILTTDDFDATTVDPLSVAFGSDGAEESHGKGHIEDVDRDGDFDLVLHFRSQETGITCGDTEAGLTGETFDGQAIQGFDSINTIGCSGGSIVGTWDLIQDEDGNAVPSGTATLIVTNTTYDLTSPDCHITGTYFINGTIITLAEETITGNDCHETCCDVNVVQFTVTSTTLTLETSIWKRI